MKFTSENIGRLLASGRGYAQAMIGIAGTLGVLSAAQQKTLTESIADIIAGLSQVAHGLTSIWQILVIVGAPIASIILARWSSNTAKTVNQATAVQTAVKEADGNPATQLPMEIKAKIIDSAARLPDVKNNNPPIKVGDSALATAIESSNVVAR